MDAKMIMEISAIMLGITAAAGLTMAYIGLKGTPRPPAWMVGGHGLAVVTGLTFLIYAVVAFEVPFIAELSLALFVLVAVAGIGMNIVYHMKLLPLPIPLMILHAALATVGFVFLLVGIFRLPLAETFWVAPI